MTPDQEHEFTVMLLGALFRRLEETTGDVSNVVFSKEELLNAPHVAVKGIPGDKEHVQLLYALHTTEDQVIYDEPMFEVPRNGNSDVR